MKTTVTDFIKGIPKAELHVHIEGTFEPELMFKIAQRNNIKIRFNSVEEIRAAYQFSNLQEFLDIYYEGAAVLITEQDFYDLTMAYLTDAHAQNILHTEIFFDPQTHTDRGIAFETVITGINKALEDGMKKFGITSKLILCFLRHLSEDAAMQTLRTAMPYRAMFRGVGLDSSELGHPPSKFKNVFAKAKMDGFLTVAHAGEEGPAEYVWEALDMLHISRIDHGNHSLDDAILTNELARQKMPLTVCPLSNLKLKVVKELKDHPIRTMLEKGLLATINSDDPAYFGGNVNANFFALYDALELTKEEIRTLAENSFKASFLSEADKKVMLEKVSTFYREHAE